MVAVGKKDLPSVDPFHDIDQLLDIRMTLQHTQMMEENDAFP